MMKKKILVTVFALLLVTGIVGTFWGPDIVNATSRSIWNSCPKGKVNDYYPGDCHDYIDTNSDDICDRSQADPSAAVTTTISAVAVPTAITTAITTTPATAPTTTDAATGTNQTTSYYLLPVALVCIALYIITWTLSATKKIKLLAHRKIWNVVLLVTLLASILLGLERILLKDLNVEIPLPFNTLFWHVEISIVLGVVAVFHIIWHWRYWVKLVRGKQEAKPVNTD